MFKNKIILQLPNYGNRASDVERYIKLSLKKLGLDYIDIYLIHMPFAFVEDKSVCGPSVHEDGSYQLDLDTEPIAVWKV